MKKEAYTKPMHTCLTAGGAQLALDLPVPVGSMTEELKGEDRIYQPQMYPIQNFTL